MALWGFRRLRRYLPGRLILQARCDVDLNDAVGLVALVQIALDQPLDISRRRAML